MQDITRRFGRIEALRGLNMVVPEGSVYGFLGNNGAGKTTAIHTLLGLIPATTGQGRVLGMDIRRQGPEIRRSVGFFAERDEPYDWMPVGLLLRMAGHTFPAWDANLAEQLRDRFDLDPRKKIKELSKGMVAKAKLVVALSHRPALLVLDEPTSGLDPNSRYDLLDTIRQQSRESGVTILFSSHNLDEVERIANHVGIVHQGVMRLETSLGHITEHFGLLAEPEPPAALWPLVLAAGRIDDRAVVLLSNRHDPAVVDYAAQKPEGFLRPTTLPEAFRLITGGAHRQNLQPAAHPSA